MRPKKPTKHASRPVVPRGKRVLKWQILENVIAAVESALGKTTVGLSVKQNVLVACRDGKRKRRQVDVLVTFVVAGRTFRLALDVKSEGRPLDVESVEQLAAKRKKLADIDRYVVVSVSGFTAEGLDEARATGIETMRVERLSSLDWWAAIGLTMLVDTFELADVVFEVLAGTPPSVANATSILETPDGTRRLLTEAIEAYASGALAESRPQFVDGQRISPIIAGDAVRDYARLFTDGVEYPMPHQITAGIVLRRQTVLIPPQDVIRGREGVEAVAFVMPDGQQLTVIAVPQEGGGFTMAISRGPAHPQRAHAD
jgi:hypothetical protein